MLAKRTPGRQRFERAARLGLFMRSVVLIATAFLASCSPDAEATGTVHNKCATALYPAYNQRALNQCVAVCIKCDHGTTTTCSTSCTLKGAR
jgi:hypothetical protein